MKCFVRYHVIKRQGKDDDLLEDCIMREVVRESDGMPVTVSYSPLAKYDHPETQKES